MPDGFIKKINTIIYDFIRNKKDRIKRNIITLPIDKGGINMLDIESFFHAIKASWVKRIIDGPHC
jgi:hypothetical protein